MVLRRLSQESRSRSTINRLAECTKLDCSRWQTPANAPLQPWTAGVKLPEPDTVQSYNLFLSSSDEGETQRLRNRVQRLVNEVINPRLNEYEQVGVRLNIERWEQTAPQRVAAGEVNQLFVAKARRSALTLVLLLDEIRPGTREEFEAAIAEPQNQVSVLIFDRPGGPDSGKVAERDAYLRPYRDEILYSDRCGEPDSDDAWIALVNTLLTFTFSAMQQSDRVARGSLTEVRQ